MALSSRGVMLKGLPRSSALAPLKVCRLHEQRHAPRTRCVTVRAAVDQESSVEIEGLSTDYCNDFVCVSSPYVETTVKAAARGIGSKTQRLASSMLVPDVKYQDKYRSLSGIESYRRLSSRHKNIADMSKVVNKVRMKNKGTAVINWSLQGKLWNAVPVQVTLDTELDLNLLTGRVEAQRESWDTGRCSLPGKVGYELSRALWSADEVKKDAIAGGAKVMASLSMDEDDDAGSVYRDPTDPTKFFQQQDNTMQDAVTFATVLALLYLLVLGWKELEKLH